MTTVKAAILGCEGSTLSSAEAAFFRAQNPWGFILFQRNCEEPDQVRALVGALREAVGRADAPVLIDQEGGRVARLKPPHWRPTPAPGRFAQRFAQAPELAVEGAWLNARLIARDLHALGITVDCAPVLDVLRPETHNVIGDRAYGRDPEVVAAFGRAVADGLKAGGVHAVMKHIPGHGRATVDSHFTCPRVAATMAELADDFLPFQRLSDLPFAMTAHVIYDAIDTVRPATLSPAVIERAIRGAIGFSGLLISDDLSMNALGGRLGERAAQALAAGCDIALHCNGRFAEMAEVMAAVGPLSDSAWQRIAALPVLSAAAFDPAAAAARVEALVAA
ncbi:MAG: beta-N-acetylhexosaminidase [Thalassobaculales bacterium]